MADRTIEILLQFKQLGQELLKQTNAQLKDLQKPAAAAGAALEGMGGAGTTAAENLGKGMKQAGAAGKTAAAEVEGSWKKMLDGLKASAGKGSVFTETMNLLLGGGIAIGISMLGSALNGAVQKAVAIKQQLNEGTLRGTELTLKIGEAIPLIGTFVEAGQGINELFTGAKAEAAMMAKEIQTGADRLKEFATAARAVRDTMREMQAFGRQLSTQLPHDADTAALLRAQADRATLEAASEAAKRKIDDANAKQLEEAQKIEQEATDRLTEAMYFQDQVKRLKANPLSAEGMNAGREVFFRRGPYQGKFFGYGTADAAKEVEDAIKGTKGISGMPGYVGTEEATNRLRIIQQNIRAAKEDIDGIVTKAKDDLAALRVEAERQDRAQRNITREQVLGQGASGADKIRLDAQVAYDQQAEKLRQDVHKYPGLLSGKELDGVTAKMAADQMETIRHAMEQMDISHEDMLASLERGTQKQVAQARVEYDKDVENWKQALFQKKVNQEQYDAAMIALTRQREAKIREIEFSRAQAQGAVNVLMLQSQHQATAAKLAAIDLETAASAEGYHRQATDGLITAEQYDAALEALQREAADKRLMVNGSFVDGMRIGFQTLEANMLTMAQIGSQVAGQIARGFGEAFSSMIMGTKSAAQAFGQMAVSILADLAKIFAEQAMVSALSPVFSIMTAGLAGAFGGMFGAGGTATAAGDAPMMGGAYGRGMATGGLIPGVDTGRDHVPVLARGGEFMVRPEAVRQPGILSMLQAINSGYPRMSLAGAAGSLQRFAEGGMVKAMAGAGGGGAGGLRVLPVLAADTNTARKLIGGNVNVLADVMRENVTLFAGILRNGGGG